MLEPNSAKRCHQIIDLGGLLTMTALEETKEEKTKEEKTEKVDGLVEHIMQEARNGFAWGAGIVWLSAGLRL
jgi:hypothetical protein